MEKLEKFIKENELKFNGTGSALNSSCTIIAGFADHCGVTDASDILEAIQEATEGEDISSAVSLEISRVFDFAYTYNYGNWWKSAEAKRTYKF